MKLLCFTLVLFFSISMYADEIQRINSITKEIQTLRLQKQKAQMNLDKCNQELELEKDNYNLIKNLEKKTFNEFPKLKMKSNL